MEGMIGKTERVVLDAAAELLGELEDAVHVRTLVGVDDEQLSTTAVLHLGQLRQMFKRTRDELTGALSWHDILTREPVSAIAPTPAPQVARLEPPAAGEGGELA